MGEMNYHRVEVFSKVEPKREQVLRLAQSLRVAVGGCRVSRLYWLSGELGEKELECFTQKVLSDPISETYTLGQPGLSLCAIEVANLPGVTDPAAENLIELAKELGYELKQAATGWRYALEGFLSEGELLRLATELHNPVVQQCAVAKPIQPPFITEASQYQPKIEIIKVRGLSDDALLALSKSRRLALDRNEMRAIQAHYAAEGHDPTDAELEMLAQTWSEHCVHKTFKARIQHGDETIDGLFGSYIRTPTEQLNKPWVRSAFVDNAGIVAFDEEYDLAFKVETHNHPSALEPFGGANTGVGGVVRDVIGVSARPIANTDVLCFGPLDTKALPSGTLHPQRIMEGVVEGIADYGNKMGIPTVNGAIFFHTGYVSNPLVFCGSLGLLPRRESYQPGEPEPGDLIVVIGGHTGRDGIGGATFSSLDMDTSTSQIAGSSVQIGHPIHEKQTLEAIMQARDEGLYRAITDCGAGGLSSAVGEMAKGIGARVDLTKVPLKYAGLQPWEIWLSEAQERMVLAVVPQHWPRIKAICDEQDIDAVAIGTFEPTGRVKLSYGDLEVADISTAFLHKGIPQKQLVAEVVLRKPSPRVAVPGDVQGHLLGLLASPNIRSKESVIRRYDHEVKGATAVKPLVGADNHGPSDAAVIVPNPKHLKAVALSVGLCPQYGEHDPYAMAFAAVDEALRNAVAVGADPDQICILDNFCWGNPTLPDRLGTLVATAKGCHDAALAYEAPYISGKDSLYNEYVGLDGERHAIPGTLLISALGIVPDVRHSLTMDFKKARNLIYMVGLTKDEAVPQPVEGALELMRSLHKAIRTGFVHACHDCSEGGLAVALAEMCLAGRLGAAIDLGKVPVEAELSDAANEGGLSDAAKLFSESAARFVLEVDAQQNDWVEAMLLGHPFAKIGEVTKDGMLRVGNLIELPVEQLEEAWR
jgi:phosphoribosylformylglycinamidine synthase